MKYIFCKLRIICDLVFEIEWNFAAYHSDPLAAFLRWEIYASSNRWKLTAQSTFILWQKYGDYGGTDEANDDNNEA